MTKIPNLFNQNPLIISQGRHTQGWGTMSASVAIDFAYIGDLICPFDGCRVELHSNSDQGQQSYFSLILPDGSRLICVHGYPIRTGTFKKGEVVGKCRWHHWHISMVVGGQLDCVLCYLDRSITLETQPGLYNGDKHHPDGRWETYEDKQLNILTNQSTQNTPKPMDSKLFTVKQGGWRSQVIEEIIQVGIWSGTWQENQPLFDKFNPVTPQGGYKPGDIVRIAEEPVSVPPPVEIPKPTPTIIDPTPDSRDEELKVLRDKVAQIPDLQKESYAKGYSESDNWHRENGWKSPVEIALLITKAKDEATNQNISSGLQDIYNEQSKVALEKVNHAAGVKIEQEQFNKGIGYFTSKIFDRLTSSRFWLVIGGPALVEFLGKDLTLTVATIMVLGAVYMLSEYWIRYKSKTK
jgi:hypothetical protein